MKKFGKLFAIIIIPLVVLAAEAHGQSALDGFNPNANAAIRVVVVQPDGKILIGGDFTTVLGVARIGIARLNPDGALDTAFNPNADSSVISIAVQADGKILAGGGFTTIGGQPRNRIARLDGTTGLADSFNPNASDAVEVIAVQADGKILAGGLFNGANSIGGQTRNYIARLDATTGLADSFNPNAGSAVRAIGVQADGKILVGGIFLSIGGQTRRSIARLDSTTGLADSFNPNANGFVNAFAVQADGRILVGGEFNGASSIGGQTRNRIARLDATTGLADSFNPNANNSVISIAVQADGKILAGGFFSGANSIGGQTRNRIARLDATTGLGDSFDPNANNSVFAIAVQADGKILVGGAFTAVAPNGGTAVTRNRMARLETDGKLDQTLNLGIVGIVVHATVIQPDGKILVGGGFTSVLGVPRNNIARLNADGTLDASFNPNANATVRSIAVQPDGKILAGGDFSGANSIGGQTRNRIARLDATTGLADSFNPNANSAVRSIAVQADGKILAGGLFTGPNSIGGQSRNRIARLDAATGLADSFDPNANNRVNSVVVQADGKILAGGEFNGANSIGGQTRNRIARLDPATGLADSFDPNANVEVFAVTMQSGKVVVGGLFTTVGGQARNFIARLDATTALADSFNPNANGNVNSIAAQADGKILAGGNFTGIGGQTRNRIARLDATTGLADLFDPNADDVVNSIAVQADGKILVGGDFTNSIGGQTRNVFARLSNDTAALQNLAVTQTTITWTRSGSSPQFTRVTFESSTDNVNYIPRGNGTPSGSNWTLTGLTFPTGQNFFVRARGYYRGGNQNGSESIAELVRNVFIAGTTPTPTPTATPTPAPPMITSPRTAAATVGLPFVYQFQTIGATSRGVTNLAPGLSFDPTLAAIIGTPTAAGSFPVGLNASNSNGTTSATLNLTVQPIPSSGPVIVSSTSVSGRVGQPFLFRVITRGGTSAARLTATNLPPGLTFDAVTGFISGTPTVEGSTAAGLSVTDGNLTTTAVLQLTFISSPSLPVIISSSSAFISPGQAFSYTINAPASSPDAPIFTMIGSLPPGLGFNSSTGTISGIFNPPPRPSNKPPDQPNLSGGVITNVQLFATNPDGTSTIPLVFFLPPTGTVNISTRLAAGTGNDVLIAGFIITGNAPKKVIIRALGPSLPVPGALQDTMLALHDGNGVLGSNDDWRGNQQNEIIATTIAPTDDRESALIAIISPGNYTAIVNGKNNTTGLAVVELYDLGTASLEGSSQAKLAQISTRGTVLGGDSVMIGGFIISGQPTKVIVRAIGPSLSAFGVPGALQDTTLELRDGSGSLINMNDDWRGSQEQQIIDTGVPPTNDRESAVVATLTPGNYTGIVRGKDNTTGVALVEVYGLQ